VPEHSGRRVPATERHPQRRRRAQLPHPVHLVDQPDRSAVRDDRRMWPRPAPAARLTEGDTPLPAGGTLVTELDGSWIDGIGPRGNLMWSLQAPVAYPSDAQWLGEGRILL